MLLKKLQWPAEDDRKFTIANIHHLIRYLFTAEELKSNYHMEQNSFTVELLIGLAWNAEQTPYLYFLDLIKLHWELYVFIASFPTP